MIVMKFGGTSVADADALIRSARIVVERGRTAPVVVVSAMGGATRELLGMGADAAAGRVEQAIDALTALVRRHMDIVTDLGVESTPTVHQAIGELGNELEALLKGVGLLREFGPSTRDAVAGFGERFSSPVFACALASQGRSSRMVDMREVMVTDSRFGDARPVLRALDAAARRTFTPLLSEDCTVVTQGYIGRTREGRPTTLGLEASDYTATLLGATLAAEEVQIWTDVSGMMTADPRIVPEARPIPELRFEDAAELALLGAKVLHPRSMAPIRRAGIPARIKNSHAPDDPGTRIGVATEEPQGVVTSIALLSGVTYVRVTPETRDERLLQRVGDAVDQAGLSVRLATVSPLGVTVIVDGRQVPSSLADHLGQLGDTTVDAETAALSVVGPGVEQPEVLRDTMAALQEVPVRAVIQGASPHSVSVVVPEAAGPAAIQRMHAAMFA